MASRQITPLAPHFKAWVAVSLAWAAGYIDIVTWLLLEHVYSSHMTGNTASFAHGLAAGHVRDAFIHGWPIVPFLAGLLYSAATTKIARRHGIHSSFSIALITEVFLIGLFLILNLEHTTPARGAAEYFLLSLPCAAMGIQTVTVTNINGLRVYTTYLTGSLSKFSESVIEYVFWWKDRMKRRSRGRIKRVFRVALRQKSIQHAALTAGLWTGFFTGAISGVLVQARFPLSALLAPLAVLAAAIIVDLLWPVAAADEPAAKDSAH